MKIDNRRRFLKTAAMFAGGTALSAGGIVLSSKDSKAFAATPSAQ